MSLNAIVTVHPVYGFVNVAPLHSPVLVSPAVDATITVSELGATSTTLAIPAVFVCEHCTGAVSWSIGGYWVGTTDRIECSR